jgi:hypothetical protein
MPAKEMRADQPMFARAGSREVLAILSQVRLAPMRCPARSASPSDSDFETELERVG